MKNEILTRERAATTQCDGQSFGVVVLVIQMDVKCLEILRGNC